MKWRYYIAIGLYCAFIFWISSQSRPPGSDFSFDGADKIAHFLVYGILAGLVSIGLHSEGNRYSGGVRLLGPILFAALYGVSDEIHQYFVPGRTFSYADMAADGLGALTAHGLCLFWFRRRAILADTAEVEGTP